MPSKRTARRRGRGPHEEDEEDIERAVQTDSDSSMDDSDDETSSDSEPVSRHPTPNTSHSPDEKPPFFSATPTAWADMVDDGAGLPVINFGEFDAHLRVASPSPPPPTTRTAPAPAARRPAGQSARQAYQERLDSDPAFVPVVGEFWGHDDRLLDKDLRSLSGWWRGRWQGRGRARGMFPVRGRGRGGFVEATPPTTSESPMDRTWTHDGFEEMRRREDARRGPRGVFRGRGNAPPPGRPLGRPWFLMKPELMWTKQHEGFLFFDPALKARPGQPAGLRVRMPGGDPSVVRAIPRVSRTVKPPPKTPTNANFVVRLPRTKQEQEQGPPPPADPPIVVKLGPTTANASLRPDADGWVSPDAAAVALATVSSPPAGPPAPLPAPAFFPFAPPPGLMGFPPGPAYPPFSAPQPVAAFSSPSPQGFTPPPPAFSTPPPPGFGTPPGFSTPLPPGVAVDQRGGLYELASGRPVMLFNGFHSPSPSMSALGLHNHNHSHSHSMHHDPPLFAFARPKTKVEIRAPDGTGLLASSPLSPRSPADDGGVRANGKGKLRTGAAAFVPSHNAHAASGSGFYPPASFDAGAPSFEPQAGGVYDPYGAYVPTQFYYPPPATTYYQPHPHHQHQHSQSLAGGEQQGTVYYA
ncbi:hypothetical protein C8F01DRAFT_1247146 [Mycena amicta]|nr:hypothetical protein C8F01DRAFT_1247146 [Mycena amicta]